MIFLPTIFCIMLGFINLFQTQISFLNTNTVTFCTFRHTTKYILDLEVSTDEIIYLQSKFQCSGLWRFFLLTYTINHQENFNKRCILAELCWIQPQPQLRFVVVTKTKTKKKAKLAQTKVDQQVCGWETRLWTNWNKLIYGYCSFLLQFLYKYES